MKTKKLTLLAILLALSVAGSHIKIFASIALDSFPAFFASMALGPGYGAAIAIFGHFISAFLAGFPLSVPIHIFLMGVMAATMVLYGHAFRKYVPVWPRLATGLIVNVVVALGLLLLVLPWPVIAGLFPPLSIGTVLNIGLAELAYGMMPTRLKS